MDNLDNIKPLSEQIVDSLLKDEAPKDLEAFDALSQADKTYILHTVTNRKEREKLIALKHRLDKEKAWEAIMGHKKASHTKRSIFSRPYQIAASIAILLALSIGLTFVFTEKDEVPTDVEIADHHIEIGSDKAILTLEDGSKVRLEQGALYQSGAVTSNGETLTYLTGEPAVPTETIAYNTLTVPLGGQYQITLSDGTKIWLNSGTEVTYPVAISGLPTRQVTLVYGEAYFEVSPSEYHQGAPFKVWHQSQEVEVLGTAFNIKAYKDETNIYTTLVEGKVAVRCDEKEQSLEPSQQLTLNLENNEISVTTLENTYDDVSWKQEAFSFQKKALKDIMQVLSRWYDMEVIFENKTTAGKLFTGSFQKRFSIERVLSLIKKAGIIQDYLIQDKTVTIK